MPMIKPRQDEKKEDFISRFMSDDTMIAEFPDDKQRSAIAFDQWRKKMESKENSYQSYKQNISPLIRYVTKNNIKFMVAPMTMMLEQCVMNGVLYLKDAVHASCDEWNGRQVVIYHPKTEGVAISANNPDTFISQNVGTIFNSKVSDKKLKAEAWIEMSKVENLEDGKKFLKMLEENKNIDVSTGMKISGYKENGSFGGNEYEMVANQITPDHLAILLEEKGACSWHDGAGFARNKEEKTNALKNKELNQNKELSNMERKAKVSELIKSGVIAENQRKAFEEMQDGAFDSFESLAKENKELVGKVAKAENDAKVAQNANNKDYAELQAELNVLKENAEKAEKAKKQVHIDVILANNENTLTQEQLIAMDCEVLEGIAKLNKKADYSANGANGNTVNAENADSESRAKEITEQFNK